MCYCEKITSFEIFWACKEFISFSSRSNTSKFIGGQHGTPNPYVHNFSRRGIIASLTFSLSLFTIWRNHSEANASPTLKTVAFKVQYVNWRSYRDRPFKNTKSLSGLLPEDADEVCSATARRVVTGLVWVELSALLTASLHRLTPDHLELRVVQQPSVHKRHQRPVTIETESQTSPMICNRRDRVIIIISDL